VQEERRYHAHQRSAPLRNRAQPCVKTQTQITQQRTTHNTLLSSFSVLQPVDCTATSDRQPHKLDKAQSYVISQTPTTQCNPLKTHSFHHSVTTTIDCTAPEIGNLTNLTELWMYVISQHQQRQCNSTHNHTPFIIQWTTTMTALHRDGNLTKLTKLK
jgi:hypothetical protein